MRELSRIVSEMIGALASRCQIVIKLIFRRPYIQPQMDTDEKLNSKDAKTQRGQAATKSRPCSPSYAGEVEDERFAQPDKIPRDSTAKALTRIAYFHEWKWARRGARVRFRNPPFLERSVQERLNGTGCHPFLLTLPWLRTANISQVNRSRPIN